MAEYAGWELTVIIGLMVILIASYAIGSIANRRIQRSFWRALREELRRYSRRVSFKSFGSSGFKVGFRPRSGPLRKVEVSLVLLAREMPLYLPIAYALGRRDRVIIKANLAGRPDFYLEIFGRKTPLSKEIKLKLEKFKPLDIGPLSRHMSAKASKPGRAAKFLSGPVLERLVSLRECLERFSVSRSEPHIMIVCRRDEGAVSAMFELLDEAARALSEQEAEPTRGRRRRR